MTTINEQISLGTDDCEETSDASVNLTGTTLTLGRPFSIHDVGLRWQSVNIPNGATISSAILSIYIASENGDLDATAKGIDEDNTATWASDSRPSQRSHVGSVNADEASWGNWGVGNWATLNITTIIQSIVNRAGWSTNNALAVVLISDVLSGAVNITMRAYEYAGNAHGAKLDINYDTGRTTKNTRATTNVHSGVLFQTITSGHGY